MLLHRLLSRLPREEAQTMTEYTVVLGLIVLVTIATFTMLGDSVESAIRAVTGIVFK